MKPNAMKVLELCIERGVAFGVNRAYKHDDEPSIAEIEKQVTHEIINAVYEFFDIEEKYGD